MPSNAQNAQGTTLEISGAGGGAKTITAIALGFPTILTSVAHGLDNGDVVTLAAFAGADAADLNGQSVVIKNVTADTFAFDIDTTGKDVTDNTDTATATPLSWIGVGEIVSGAGFDGTSAVIPKTNLASTAKEKEVGLQDFGSLKLEIQIYDDDAGQTAMKAAKASQASKNFRVTYPDASTRTFAGFVMSFSESFGVDAMITGSTEILIDGEVTYA
jgi:hypothetical protein